MFRRDLFHDCAPLDFHLIFGKRLSTEPSKILVLTGPDSAHRSRGLPLSGRKLQRRSARFSTHCPSIRFMTGFLSPKASKGAIRKNVEQLSAVHQSNPNLRFASRVLAQGSPGSS